MKMSPEQEKAYLEGQRALLRRQLSSILIELGYSDSAQDAAAALILEREEAIAMLRQVCGEHGDNDWEDDLHLSDVIEKHLWRHLEDAPAPSLPGH
jgi:hypothetical protein